MKIAVINESSAADKNSDIIKALEGRGHEIINAGVKKAGSQPELLYVHTGLMTAILLELKRVDFVIGGCGTGQGYLISAMQYPGVYCGHILTPLDAWLFMQINGGNCISLALNQGYGWAGDVNLKLIFDQLFSVERGSGYPAHRKEPQKKARLMLEQVSNLIHYPFHEIIKNIPDEILLPAITYPGMLDIIQIDSIENLKLKDAFNQRLKK